MFHPTYLENVSARKVFDLKDRKISDRKNSKSLRPKGSKNIRLKKFETIRAKFQKFSTQEARKNFDPKFQ